MLSLAVNEGANDVDASIIRQVIELFVQDHEN